MPHIVVAGAGIGGLVTALALADAGARVTVLERRPTPTEFGAGLQLSPNATRVLARLRLLERLRPLALEPRSVRVRRGRDAADLVRFPLGNHAVERYGAPFLLILRPDLQRLLAEEAAVRPAIELRFAVEVRGAEANGSDGVSVATSSGTIVADGFVDARGVGVAQARPSGRVAWRALVPAAGFGSAQMQPDTNLWLGPRTHLVHYPVPGGASVNVVAVTEDRGTPLDAPLGPLVSPWRSRSPEACLRGLARRRSRAADPGGRLALLAAARRTSTPALVARSPHDSG